MAYISYASLKSNCIRYLFGTTIGNLSTDVFEPRTATGSRMFSFLALSFASYHDRKTLLFMSAI